MIKLLNFTVQINIYSEVKKSATSHAWQTGLLQPDTCVRRSNISFTSSTWCAENNLILNTSKNKELIVDYRRNKPDIQPIYMNGESGLMI